MGLGWVGDWRLSYKTILTTPLLPALLPDLQPTPMACLGRPSFCGQARGVRVSMERGGEQYSVPEAAEVTID